jgi:4a-hydroxytetrahydrobiopterin dehydratase
MERLGNEQIAEAGLVDWRKLAQGLHARFLIPDYATAAGFLLALAQLPDGPRADVRLSNGALDVSVGTREDGRWVTPADVELARAITDVARDQGLPGAPGMVTQLELALDTAAEDRVGPFWAALLTGAAENKIYDSVFDPSDRVPSLWFQPTDEHEPPRQRWHFDLWLAPEVVDERIAAAVGAGGTVVYDAEAPAFTVLADPDGNRVCVCCSLGRG